MRNRESEQVDETGMVARCGVADGRISTVAEVADRRFEDAGDNPALRDLRESDENKAGARIAQANHREPETHNSRWAGLGLTRQPNATNRPREMPRARNIAAAGSSGLKSGTVLLSIDPCGPPIIDAGGLNCRVRDGNGWNPAAISARNLIPNRDDEPELKADRGGKAIQRRTSKC